MNIASNAHKSEMQLYDRAKRRLYVNAAERARFIEAAGNAELLHRSFGLTLAYTGCRISEALELTTDAFQLEAKRVTLRTLKRRHARVMREVPVPDHLIAAIREMGAVNGGTGAGQPLWQRRGSAINRTSAYRWIKAIMAEAGIHGAQACPKGLRHGYGIHAMRSGVQLNMLSKWMGHASMETTAIYANAMGEDELAIAERMWCDAQPTLAGDGIYLPDAARREMLRLLSD